MNTTKDENQAAVAGQADCKVRLLSRDEQVREHKAWSDWAWNKDGEAVGLQDGQAASREAWLARAQVAAAERERGTTHSDGCWTWGPRHYQCAVAEAKWMRGLVQAIVDTRHTYGWGPEADAAIESARVGLGPKHASGSEIQKLQAALRSLLPLAEDSVTRPNLEPAILDARALLGPNVRANAAPRP